MQSELNNQLGYSVAWDRALGRVKVWMDIGSGKLVRPFNLEVCSSSSSPLACPRPSVSGREEDFHPQVLMARPPPFDAPPRWRALLADDRCTPEGRQRASPEGVTFSALL